MHAQNGLALAESGDLPSSEQELRKAVALAPGNADWLVDLATILAIEKKFDESTSYFQKSLKINPGNSTARRYLAANLWQLHRYPEARQTLRILLREQPGDPQALLLLGMVSENTRDYTTAAKTLASVPALVRVQPESIAALARSYYHLGETDKARIWLQELQGHPAGVRAVLLGAQIADEMQDYETAERLLSSVTTGPAQNDLRYELALVKFHSRQYGESKQILQQLLDSGHNTIEVHRLLASCLQAENRPEEAIQALEKTIEVDPGNESSYIELANALLSQKKITSATNLAERMGKTFPDSLRILNSKGTIELGAGKFTDAVATFSRATQLDPSSSEATIGLARAEASAGMTDKSKATLERAIVHFPEKAPFELELGQVLLKEADAGNKIAENKAEQLLRSAVAHDDKLANAHYELGELALRRGQPAKAVVHLERAEKLAPSDARIHFALSRTYRLLGREQDAATQSALFEKLRDETDARSERQ